MKHLSINLTLWHSLTSLWVVASVVFLPVRCIGACENASQRSAEVISNGGVQQKKLGLDEKNDEQPRRMRLTSVLLHQFKGSNTPIDKKQILETIDPGKWDKSALAENGLKVINRFEVEIVDGMRNSFNFGQEIVVSSGSTMTARGDVVKNYRDAQVGTTLKVLATTSKGKTQLDLDYATSFYVGNMEAPDKRGAISQLQIKQLQLYDGAEAKQSTFSRQGQSFLLVTLLVPIQD